MTLSSLVLSRDWPEISVLECILGSLHMNVEVEPEPERALARLAKSKIDALIVDCDLSGASTFLRGVRNVSTQKTVPLVILGGSNGRHLEEDGASFVFQKPISVEQAVHTLSAARNQILEERLRYHRERMDIPVWLSYGSKKRARAHLMNLSQKGMGIRMARPVPVKGPLQISFALPGTKRSMKIPGEIVWMDQQSQAGVRFFDLKPRTRRDLQLWLERQYFNQK
jgi:PilZ domain-containing protein